MAKQFANGYALIIGVDENSVSRWALEDVAKDVKAVEQVLTDPELCAYPKENIKVIRGKDATRMGILSGLAWLRKRLEADTGDNETAVLYYSGHGWRDDTADPVQSYLIPYDVMEDQIALSALEADALAKGIAALDPQRLLVVLDCCHAGSMGVKGAGTLPSGFSVAAIEPSLLMGGAKSVWTPGAKGVETLSTGRGRAVLNSSTSEQESYMRKDGKMSIFTYHLIEALTGHAQPKAGAKEVLVTDVMGHVTRCVPESAHKDWSQTQTPESQTTGVFPIAMLLGGKGWSEDQVAPDPIKSVERQASEAPRRTVDTGGGTYVEGNVSVQGDFVGRDRITRIEGVDGPVAVGGGEAVDMRGAQGAVYKPEGPVSQHFGNGDHISFGDVTGDNANIAAGRYAQATATHGLTAEGIANAFAPIYDAIKTRQNTAPGDRADMEVDVQEIEEEVAKGDDADESFLMRRFRNLKRMAPDILDVVLKTLANPVAGLGTVVAKIAEKAKAEAG